MRNKKSEKMMRHWAQSTVLLRTLLLLIFDCLCYIFIFFQLVLLCLLFPFSWSPLFACRILQTSRLIGEQSFCFLFYSFFKLSLNALKRQKSKVRWWGKCEGEKNGKKKKKKKPSSRDTALSSVTPSILLFIIIIIIHFFPFLFVLWIFVHNTVSHTQSNVCSTMMSPPQPWWWNKRKYPILSSFLL